MPKSLNTFQEVLFRPSVRRSLFDGHPKSSNVTLAGLPEDEANSNPNPTSSFRYDPPGAALKSTQQLNVDFSKFENHAFFNSAEMKVQVAFDKIINEYPFDGTRSEYENFMDGLSGFQRYVFDEFPKHRGYLNFNNDSSMRNYLSVVTLQGAADPTVGRKNTGTYVLSLDSSPFTAEMQLFVASEANDCTVIAQKIAAPEVYAAGKTFYKGFTLALSQSTSTENAQLVAILSSGSGESDPKLAFITASTTIQKGKFQHVAAVYDRNRTGKMSIFLDGRLAATSSAGVFGKLGIEAANFTIGSGSTVVMEQQPSTVRKFVPKTFFSGAIDELRVFESVRSVTQLKKYSKRSLSPPNDGSLKLYFKFNEPSGSFAGSANQDLTLDYSGNGLHTRVSMGGTAASFDLSLRSTTLAGAVPLTTESLAHTPILFPSFASVTSLCNTLLTSASQYDFNNPNLITKMIPKHYLMDESLANENGELSENYGYFADVPGGGQMRSAQIIASLLYLWADTFDEIKMFVDDFGKLTTIDYDSKETISDQLLPFLARYYGFNLPNQFANASMQQYFDGEDLTVNSTVPQQSLQKIQNTLWRRVLADLPNLFNARGTRDSIESLFRDLGINPNGSFRIKEYGGSMTRKIGDSYEKRTEIAAMLDFSGSLNNASADGLNGSGKDPTRPLIQSGFLSGSRIEPGVPEIRGTMTDGRSNNANDGLFTSGSWTMEGVFKLENKLNHRVTQSLLRLQTTGSRSSGASNNWLLFNAVAFAPITGRQTGSISLFGRPASGSTAPTLKLTLSGTDIFDGNKWHVSFGRHRNDQIGSYTSSSYFLRAGQMGSTKIRQYNETSTYFNDYGDNALNRINSGTNASGSMLVIGSQSLQYDSSMPDAGFLNTHASNAARWVDFSGKVSNLTFYSKNMSSTETRQHVRNHASLGVEDPSVNFNFNTTSSGSFERLRLNLTCDQPITNSVGGLSQPPVGDIRIFDFSQNQLHASGTGWNKELARGYPGYEGGLRAIRPETFHYVILSPQFEHGVEPNKIRIRSFLRSENIERAPDGVSRAPLYRIPPYEQPKDDRRLSIEVSAVQALNEDIIKIFATLDYLDNAIGDPELVFSQEYRKLSHLRRIYFNRLDDKLSIQKFFEFFKWFDAVIGDLIETMIPSTTRYLGTNFVVESHMLERPKFTYRYSDMYVGILDRREASVIFLQQFLGAIRKF